MHKLGEWEETPNLHARNAELGESLRAHVARMGLCFTRFVRNYGRTFDGFTFYVVYAGYRRPRNLRGKGILVYAQARHAKYGEPSIVGERRALESLRQQMEGVYDG